MPITHLRQSLPFLCGLFVGGIPFVAPRAAKPPAEAPRPAYRLQYEFRPNQFAHYEVNFEMSIETKKGDASQTVVNNSTTRKHYRVVSVDSAGVGTLESVIDRVEMTARFGDSAPVSYDSASPPPPPQFEDVHKTIGKPIVRVKVAPNGEFLSVDRLLPEEVQKKFSTGGGGSPDTDRSKNFLVVFPKKPVRVGESWSDKFQVPVNLSRSLQQPVTLHRRYRLESVENGLATISQRTSVITPVSNPHARAELIQRTPKGTIVFDLERGLMISQTTSVDKTEVGVFGPGSLMRAVSRRTEKLASSEKSGDPGRTASGESDRSQTQ